MSDIHKDSFYGTVAAKGIFTHLPQTRTGIIHELYPG